MKNPKPEPSTRRCFRRATKRVEARAANHLIHYEPRFPSSALEDFEFFWHLKHRDLQLRIWGVGATCHRLLTSLRLRKRLVYFNIQDLCASVVKAFWGFRVRACVALLGLQGSYMFLRFRASLCALKLRISGFRGFCVWGFRSSRVFGMPRARDQPAPSMRLSVQSFTTELRFGGCGQLVHITAASKLLRPKGS